MNERDFVAIKPFCNNFHRFDIFFIIFSQSFVSLQVFFYLSLFQLKKTKSKGAKTLAAEMKYAQLDAFPSWKLQKHQSLMKTFWTFSRAAHWHRMARFVEKRKQKLKTDFIAVSLSMCVCVHLYVDSLFGHSDRAIRRWHVTNVRYFIAWVVQQINNVHKNVRKTKCHSQQIIVKKFFTRVLRTVRRVKALGKCKDWAKVIGSKATTQEKKTDQSECELCKMWTNEFDWTRDDEKWETMKHWKHLNYILLPRSDFSVSYETKSFRQSHDSSHSSFDNGTIERMRARHRVVSTTYRRDSVWSTLITGDY